MGEPDARRIGPGTVKPRAKLAGLPSSKAGPGDDGGASVARGGSGRKNLERSNWCASHLFGFERLRGRPDRRTIIALLLGSDAH